MPATLRVPLSFSHFSGSTEMAMRCSPPSTSAYGPRSNPGRSKKARGVAVADVDVEEEVVRAFVVTVLDDLVSGNSSTSW
jgi:hypothetical protein